MNKNILICCRDAQQPPYNTMLRYHNFGKELVKRGYDVTILTSNVVHNTDIDIFERINSKSDVCDGVKYIYIKTPRYSGNGFKRFRNMAKYVLSLKRHRKLFNEPDFIIAADAYVFPFAKRINRKAKIITDITDLWPLSIIEYANLSRKNPIVQMFYYFEKKAYIKSDALIFSMEGGKDYVSERKYSSRVDQNKIFHINMGIDITKHDLDLGHPTPLSINSDDFNVGYCGSIRKANNVKQICDAANDLLLKGYSDIQFQIFGNGYELDSLQKYCYEKKITNVHFYGRIEKEKIPFILSSMQANILTYKQVGLMKYGGSQSKLFDYLAAGRPIICNAKFGYNLITRYDCGYVTSQQDVFSFSECVLKIYKMTDEERNAMGLRARKVAESYDVPRLVDSLENVFLYLSELDK